MVYYLGEELIETTEDEAFETGQSAVFIVNEDECPRILPKLGISYEREYKLEDVYFCKAEAQQDCIFGTFLIPKLRDIMGSRYRLMFFITLNDIIIVDDDGFAMRILKRILRRKVHQGESKEKFMYNFISEFMSKDSELLEKFEHRLMNMEDEALHEDDPDFLVTLLRTRKQLLTLRGYYDQISELGKILEEDENHFFKKNQTKYFGTLSDRAERLIGKTVHLIDYAQQVKDIYQSNVANQQNQNMQFLTIMSAIFYPLTLITGWYGMNFHNMPELAHGYPAVILLSIIVVTILILIFKKKKLL